MPPQSTGHKEMASSKPTVNPQQWTADTTKGSDSLIEPSIASSIDNKLSTRKSFELRPLEIQAPITEKTPRRRYIKLLFYFVLALTISAPWIKMGVQLAEDEPNPPHLPDSMVMFYPPRNDQEIQQMQALLDTYSDPILTWQEFASSTNVKEEVKNHPEYTHTSANHFTSKRTALLFTPGSYPVDAQIGYYTSLYGLGSHPDNVTFTGQKGPHCPALDKFTDRPPNGSGLNSFWRSVENIATKPSQDGMTWAVSQAAPLRRMKIYGDLNLFDDDSWVSGGFGANIHVDGSINFGGQQQWIMRNTQMARATGGAWSLVFVGCTGGVPDETKSLDESGPLISVEKAPRVWLEKPYITLKNRQSTDAVGKHEFELRVPRVRHDKAATGPQFNDDNEIRDFRRVKLAIPSIDPDPTKAAIENHSTIQKALNQGKDVVLSPGIYHLSSSLVVAHPNQVILGLGYATLVAPTDGTPCIHVRNNVPGVRIAGVMLEASVQTVMPHSKQSSLLLWGDDGIIDDGNESNPGLLSDVFARVGGSSLQRNVNVSKMVSLHSGNIIGDNLWLWRADHVALRPGEVANFLEISPLYRQTTMGECQVKNGLVVTGANVTIFGLAVEHTTEDQVIWSGENGVVYFYQCELPYDVDESYAANGYVGYRVDANVNHHAAKGLGIYSNFRDHDITVTTAVIHSSDNIQMKNIFIVKLDNMGKIGSIVNGQGPGTSTERGIPHKCLDESCPRRNSTSPSIYRRT